MPGTIINLIRQFIPLLLILGIVPWTPAQSRSSTNVNFEFEQKIPEWLKESNVPAVGVGIIENGELRYAKVFGELVKGTPKKRVAPTNTIFQVASLTKPVVEILTLILVSNGEWTLDEPLAKYWIDPDVKDDPRHEKLTTRHVLTHQSGFQNWRSMNADNKLKFIADPGTRENYSGEGLEYLRHALEKKFNEPLDQLAKKRLFPLYGMKDTHFFWDASVDESRFAVAHDKDGKPLEIYKNTKPNAADLMLTTVEDYGRFGMNVMKARGLSKSVFDDMVKPQTHFLTGKEFYFGLGWQILPFLSNGEYALIHTGNDPGVKTAVILFPKSQRGLIVFTNGENGTQVWTKILGEAFDVGKELLSKG